MTEHLCWGRPAERKRPGGWLCLSEERGRGEKGEGREGQAGQDAGTRLKLKFGRAEAAEVEVQDREGSA